MKIADFWQILKESGWGVFRTQLSPAISGPRRGCVSIEVRCVRPGATCLLQRARWETPHPHSRGSWERASGTSPPSASITDLQPGPAPVTLVTPAFDHHLPSISDVVNLWVPSSPIRRSSGSFLSESEFGEVRTLAALTSFCPSQGGQRSALACPGSFLS